MGEGNHVVDIFQDFEHLQQATDSCFGSIQKTGRGRLNLKFITWWNPWDNEHSKTKKDLHGEVRDPLLV